jgi:beta-alanine--pyruvate transaminase
LGLLAGIELEPRPGQPGKRAYDVFVACFEAGLLIRVTGDIIALSPPLIIDRSQIAQIIDRLTPVLKQVN